MTGTRSRSTRPCGRMAGALGGSLVAGLAITALMLSGERPGGAPSELTELGRAAGRRAGLSVPPDGRLPGPGEQAVVQGGHLAFSVLAGAAYAALFGRRCSVVGSGIGFGLGFYALAHGVAGPALGVKPAEWRQPPATIGTHVAVHVGFGLATALGARLGPCVGAALCRLRR